MNMRRSVPLALLTALVSASTAHAALVISHDATKNVTCSGGVCQPTAQDAVLNTGDLTSMLLGHDLTVQTGNGDGTAAGISIADGFSWTDNNRLTLSAKKSITVKAAVTVAGDGALTLNYNQGNVGGDLLFEGRGKIDFWNLASSFIVNGESFVLVGDIATLKSDIIANPTGSFALANNYDATADGPYKLSPITTFSGNFEGAGHTINGLTIRSAEKHVGLFGTLRKSALARDIVLTNATIEAKRHTGGALAGENSGAIRHASASAAITGANGGVLAGENFGTVEQSETSGSVSVYYAGAGGLVAFNYGTIRFSHSRADVTGEVNVGGLAGSNYGVIQDSSAAGKVRGNLGSTGGIGGLVGLNYNASIVRCSAIGNVSGDDRADNLGGLVGSSDAEGEIVQSFATGSVRGGDSTASVGGLVGANGATAITQSYATGTVGASGKLYAGGLLGFSDAPLNQVYSIGPASGAKYSGGLVGYEYKNAAATHGYWDVSTSGLNDGCGLGNCSGISGLTDAQLKSGLPNGFDPNIWGRSPNINNGYPYLLANPPR
jgi:hypothetical protein